MNSFLQFLSNNPLVSALVAAAIIGGAGWLWKMRRDRIESEAIYNFLVASKSETGYTFRTTQAIASHTKLPEERVATLCARHPKIRRNEKERQSWKVVS